MTEQLVLERSGGFAGLRMLAVIPAAELTPEQTAAVQECLSRAGPRPGIPEPGTPDRFQFRLALGGREITVPEPELPPALQPLLKRLEVAR